jgi:hypothetical protein
MPLVPCANPVNCIGVDSPVANLTAEAPDVAKCFRYGFGRDSSEVCEFDLSLCEAFAAVGSDVGVLCPPGPPDTCYPYCNPPPPIIYSSNAQSCVVDCGGVSESYTVAPGTFIALSQAEADQDAQNFACLLATMQCTGPSPALFTNSAQSCTVTCPDQSLFTFTTPAGFFTALSQAEADSNAFFFSCDVAALLCSGLPPVALQQSAGGTPPAPAEALWGNYAQSCGSTCADGASTYTYTVQSGTYLRESRAAANAVAFSLACDQARRRRVCLSSLDSSLCVDNFSGDFIDSTGLEAPVTFSVVSGSLPPGMSVDNSGFYQGVPTVPGAYSFTIRATGADGNFAQRPYTQTIVGIDNLSPLDDGFVGQPYAVALTQGGMSNPVWSVSDGLLPDGLTLNPNTGVISGTPTMSEDAAFTIAITDGTTTCEKEVSITVIPQPNHSWKLDEVGPGARVDAIGGVTLNEVSDPVGSAPGKISLGSRHNPGVGGVQGLTAGFVAPLAYQNNGFDFFGWINTASFSPVAAANSVTVTYARPTAFQRTWRINLFFDLNQISVETRGDAAINTNLVTPYVFTPGAWIFFRISYDATTQRFSTQFDNGAVTTGAVKPLTADASANFSFSASGNTAACDLIFDEIIFYQQKLSDAVASKIYNNGAGRSFG